MRSGGGALLCGIARFPVFRFLRKRLEGDGARRGCMRAFGREGEVQTEYPRRKGAARRLSGCVGWIRGWGGLVGMRVARQAAGRVRTRRMISSPWLWRIIRRS